MISKLLHEYSIEKNNLKKLLIGFRMVQVSYSEADYSWVLEEDSEKREQDRMVVYCEENRLYQNNLNPEILERIYDVG